MRLHFLAAASASVALASTLSCGSPDAPPPAADLGKAPPPPSPIITVSLDSVVGASLAGAAALVRDIQISAGNATALASIAVAVSGLSSGDDGSWITTTLSGTTAPATLTVRLDPKSLAAGVRAATIAVSATNAPAKTIRIQLTVRARPVLVVDKLTPTIAASLGDAIAPMTVNIKSSSDAIAALSIGDPRCDGGRWLTAALSAVATPATVSLNVDPHGLAAGTYACQVPVQSAQALVDSASRMITVTLALRQVPQIALDTNTFSRAAAKDEDAPPVVVHVTNGGTGTLDHLAVGTIDYGNGASGWVTPTLDVTTAPATLSLVLDTKRLPAGVWGARIPITSTADGMVNSPQIVTIALYVAPRPFLFRISPSSFTLTAKAHGPSVSTTVSLFDANGGTTTITRIRTTAFSCTGKTPKISSSLFSAKAIPASGSISLSGDSPTTCSITWTFDLANGFSGSLTGKFVVVK